MPPRRPFAGTIPDPRVPTDLRSLLDSIGDPLIALDAHWRIDELNAAARALDAARPGRSVFELLPTLAGSTQETLCREALNEHGRRHLGALPVANQSFDVHASALPGGGLLLHLRRSAPEGIDHDFLAMLAHDLRNPLAPLRTSVEVLRRANIPEATKERARGILDRQVTQLARLIDQLVDLARSGSGKLELHRGRIALGELIDHAFESVRTVLDEKEQRVVVAASPSPIWLQVDGPRLAQALASVLLEASRHGERGLQIQVQAQTDASGVSIAVHGGRTDAAPAATFGKAPHVSMLLAQRLVALHGGGLVAGQSAGDHRITLPADALAPG